VDAKFAPYQFILAFTDLIRLSPLRLRKGVRAMFSFFGKRPPVCPVCHQYMVAVDVRDVPEGAKREFARMNRYAPLSFSGWFGCMDDFIHVHQPTLEKSQRYNR
jgi:hypothetical protein